MRLEFLLLSVLLCVFAYGSSVAPLKDEKERFFIASGTFSFTTFTLIKASTTITSTFTTTSTCTTSTSALTTCTVGRRRRGVFYDHALHESRQRRELFYNEEEAENKDGTDFLPAEKKNDDPFDEAQKKSLSEDIVIPLEIQDGFSPPENWGSKRFLLTFGSTTITSISITTTYVSLTAICSSTSGFPICGGVGK